jgi:hypothetical protein
VKYFCEHGLRANKIYHHTDNPVEEICTRPYWLLNAEVL